MGRNGYDSAFPQSGPACGMTWFNDLLRSPDKATPAPGERPPTGASAAAPAVDPDTARAAMAAATDDEQRRRYAEDVGRALAAHQRAPLADDAPAVWAAAVSHAADKSLALRWLASLNGDPWLGEVAAHGRFAEVRLAAVLRIADPDVLEGVARLSRGKDKGVFRHCSDVLRQRRHGAEQARRAAQLEDALRALLASSPLSVTSMLDLQRDLQAIEDGSEPQTECRSLLEQANARLRQESEARRSLQAWRDEAAKLAAQCAGSVRPGTEQLERWSDGFSTLAQAQAGLPDWLCDKAASHELAASLRQIQSRLTNLAAEADRIKACEQFLSALEAGSVQPGSAWEALPKPDDPELRERLQARWLALQVAPEPAPAPPAPPPEPRAQPQPRAQPRPADMTAVRALLDRVEQALEEGHLADADAAAKKIKALLGGISLRGALGSRLQRAQTRLGELSGWAKWSAGQHREHLIAAAEELLAGTHHIDHLAGAVPALRDEWKRLNSQAQGPQVEWERFDAALTKAYQPVAAHQAEEAARRAQARSAKEALCTEWEAFAAGVDWEHPDYGAIDSQRSQMLSRWRAAPLAAFRDERILRKRFEALLAGIDQRMAAARDAEVHRREQLIVAAAALREAPDLRGAMTEAKALQERWRSGAASLRLPRSDEQKLWRRFRTACDAVFARRDAQRAEQAAQRERQAHARSAALDAFASALELTDANQIKRALAQFRTDWDATRSGTDASAEGLEGRARQLQQQAQRRIETLQRDAYRARLEALAQHAAPAASVDPETLAAGRKTRESLLIDLEIALDLPTPEEFAPARRQRQLERLQSRFRGGRQPRPQAEELLAQWHATAAVTDAAMDQRVAAVVRRLVEQREVRRPADG
jgi:DNA repair protein SbcC/Rad50